jgi:hypothetical protein
MPQKAEVRIFARENTEIFRLAAKSTLELGKHSFDVIRMAERERMGHRRQEENRKTTTRCDA